jgi:outer membrane protein OmpA-like peptidoglycan-associated protein
MVGMGDRVAPPQNDEARTGSRDPDPDEEIASLRAILVGPELRGLAALQSRLDDPEARADDIGAVLPQVLLRHAHDPHFTRALTPPLEQAITTSVQRNPKPLADALFPVMGPAIRRAVAAALAGMVESLNRTLEHAVSWRSVQWRMEALRAGKPFAEVVLSKTLLFRVEQIFLIDRRTGLLLQHAQAGTAGVQDADMVSGMLTAIRDFVQDSFRVPDADSLESLKVGELSVWVEAGPHAILAAVIRGTAPRDFRHALQDTIETIHLEFGETLESFNGDASTLDAARPSLEALLQTQYRAEERRPRTLSTWILFGVIVLGVLVWAGFAYRTRARDARYLDALRAEPGITVVSAQRRGGQLVVSGLRDPRARDPQTFVEPAGLAPTAVQGRWAPYYALDPPIMLARAHDVLQPPAGTTLELADGVLRARGTPPVAWVAEARRLAPLIAGIRGFDAVSVLDESARAVIARIEGQVLLFVKGAARLVAGQDDAVQQMQRDLREVDAIAGATGQRFRIEIVGHTDADGPAESNLPLSRTRAAVVQAAISSGLSSRLEVVVAGVGSGTPVVASEDEQDKQKNRRVVIRVTRQAG